MTTGRGRIPSSEGEPMKKDKGSGKGKDPTLDVLRKASKGLLFPSESEAPLEPFVWKDAPDKLTDKQLLKLAGAEEGATVEHMSLADFFRTVPPEDQAKFDQLAQALQEQLSGIKVYKVGDEAEKEVYLVGKTTGGQWAGLKTTVVET
jgi:Nuclease A inhibitor-like protein